ncbi:MAG: NYN domain-containing protein [Oscillospiraceae bacterium]|nr:NYN domain-containing protein [Oscillospiraceae bacterium]
MKIEYVTQQPPPEGSQQKLTVVFIDYESLYLSFLNQFATPPDLYQIIEDVKRHGRVLKIKVFGDFTKEEIHQERNRIRTVTSDIIDCGNEGMVFKKDFTDFIMLDHMYQEIIQNPVAEQFILFTGDGHFASIATFLKTFMDKTVGVYGVTGTMSRQLRDCASWYKMLRVLDEEDDFYRRNLVRNFRAIRDRGTLPTFLRTIEHTARAYGGNQNKYELILREMINAGYIRQERCTAIAGKEFTMLVPDWEKIESDLEPEPPISANMTT